MKPSDLYDATLSMVCELTGLAPDAVLQSKTEECTDARCTLVGCLAHYLTDTQMASLMGLTRQGVCYLRHSFEYSRRYRWSVGANAKEISKELASMEQAIS